MVLLRTNRLLRLGVLGLIDAVPVLYIASMAAPKDQFIPYPLTQVADRAPPVAVHRRTRCGCQRIWRLWRPRPHLLHRTCDQWLLGLPSQGGLIMYKKEHGLTLPRHMTHF